MILDPTNTTAGDLVTEALRECGAFGVGQTPLAEDTTGALARLNWLLAEWERKRWMIWHLLDYSVVSTGAKAYTVGPGGQINTNQQSAYGLQALGGLAAGGSGYAIGDTITLNGGAIVTVNSIGALASVATFTVTTPGSFTILPSTFPQLFSSGAGGGASFSLPTWEFLGKVASGQTSRPNRVESAFLRQITQSQPNQIDYPLEILESMEDYAAIALKGLVSFPGALFYDSNFPLGAAFAWPVPQASIYEIHIIVREQLGYFTTLAQKLAFPYEYYRCLLFNLALSLKSKYQIPTFPGDPLPGLAKASLATIRNANAQIPRLRMPTQLQRDGIYNIFSDRSY